MGTIQSMGGNFYPAKTSLGQKLPGNTDVKTDPASEFLSYMQKTPEQRFQEEWLKKHGLTKEDLESMSPAERNAVMEQMRAEIEEQIKQSTANNSIGNKTDILT